MRRLPRQVAARTLQRYLGDAYRPVALGGGIVNIENGAADLKLAREDGVGEVARDAREAVFNVVAARIRCCCVRAVMPPKVKEPSARRSTFICGWSTVNSVGRNWPNSMPRALS